MLPTKGSLQMYGHTQPKSEGMKKIFHTHGNQKKAGVDILLTNERDFKTNTVIKDKEKQTL